MDFKKLDQLKGFMPKDEGLALTGWAEKFTCHGPALEIGTFGAKSSWRTGWKSGSGAWDKGSELT